MLFRWQVLLYATLFILLILWLRLHVFIRARAAHGSVLRGFSLGPRQAPGEAACGAHGWLQPLGRSASLATTVRPGTTGYRGLYLQARWLTCTCPTWPKACRSNEALFMVTIFQGSNICSNSLSALIVLGEMDGAAWWKVSGYTLCILSIMVGFVCHGNRRRHGVRTKSPRAQSTV